MGATESRTQQVPDEIGQQVPRDVRTKGLGSYLDKLPNELLLYMLSFVDIVSLCRLDLGYLRNDSEKWRNLLSQRNITEFHIVDSVNGLTTNQKRQGWKIFPSIEECSEYLRSHSISGVFICCRGNWQGSFKGLCSTKEVVLYGDSSRGNINVNFADRIEEQTSYYLINMQCTGTSFTAEHFWAWDSTVAFGNTKLMKASFDNSIVTSNGHTVLISEANISNNSLVQLTKFEFEKSKSTVTNSKFEQSSITICRKAVVSISNCHFTKAVLQPPHTAVSVTGGTFYSEHNLYAENTNGVEWGKDSFGYMKADKFSQNNISILINCASPEISNCQIETSETGIHILNSSKPIITQCIISKRVTNAILVTAFSAPDSNSNNNNSFLNRKKHAVPKPQIKDNMIQDNTGGGMLFVGPCKGIICDNTIVNNKRSGMTVSREFQGTGHNNTLAGNIQTNSGFETPSIEEDYRALADSVTIPSSDAKMRFEIVMYGAMLVGMFPEYDVTVDTNAGKTTFCGQYVGGFYNDRWDPTIDDNWTKAVMINGKQVLMNWQEYGASEQFTAMRDLYFKNSHVIVLTYSIASRESFQHLKDNVDSIASVKDCSLSDCCVVVVGTKADLEDRRQVLYEEGLAFASQYGWPFIEISSRTKYNLEKMAQMVYREMLYRRYVVPNLKQTRSDKLMPNLPPIPLAPSTMVEDIAQLINKKSCSDITFVVEGKPVYASMLIILARCPKMADTIQQGTTSCEIEDGITMDAFMEFIKYVHTGVKNFTSKEQAKKLQQLARRFDLRHLNGACEKYIQSNENDTNCMDIVSRTFQILFNEDAYSDIVFEFASNKKILAHRVILLARCPLFENVLPTKLNETLSTNMKKTVIHVSLWSYEAYSSFIEFIYSDKTELTAKIAVEVLKLANQYQLKRLVSLCECFIAKYIDIQNAAAMYSVAWQNEADGLKAFAKSFVASHFSAVAKTKAFQNLTSTIEQELTASKLVGSFQDIEVYHLCRPQDYATNPLVI